MLDQCELQPEAHQRRAEQHRAIDIVALARRPAQQPLTTVVLRPIGHLAQLAPGEQQADSQVHQEEQHQERLGTPQQLGLVGAQAPGEADTEGADKTDQVQQAPGLEPGDRQNAAVQQDEVTEQGDMVAGTGGGQDRCGKTTQRRSGGQPDGILGHGENRREHRDRDQQAESSRRVEQRMQAHRGEDRQVQHRDPGALQHQAVVAVAQPQPPAQAEQTEGTTGDPGVTQFDRHHHAFSGITQQERQTEEQQQHADPQHSVTTEQPVARASHGTFDQIRFTRRARRNWRDRLAEFDRLRRPGIDFGAHGLGLVARRRFLQVLGQLPDQFGDGTQRLGNFFDSRFGRLGRRGGRCFIDNDGGGLEGSGNRRLGSADASNLQFTHSLLDSGQGLLRLL